MSSMPDEGILEKLEVHTPGSVEAVITLFRMIGDSRRAAERDALEAQYSRARRFSLWRVFGELFGGWVAPKSQFKHATEIGAAVAQATGDDLRQAILVYMTGRNISAADIGLNAEEVKSLHPKRGAVAPGCAPD